MRAGEENRTSVLSLGSLPRLNRWTTVDDSGRLWKVSEPVDDNGRPRTNPDVP
jgi:hypothetical protein